MLGVIFHWMQDASLNVSDQYLFHCFKYAAQAYNPRKIVVVDLDNTCSFGVQKVGDLTAALAEFPSYTPIYIHPSGKVDLADFEHPDKAVYIVGGDHMDLAIPDIGLSVRLGYPNTRIEQFAHIALAIVLHDRHTCNC